MKKLIVLIAGFSLSVVTKAQYNQQSPKLTASGILPSSLFGNSVAISADASVAIVGAPGGTTAGAAGQAIILERDANNIWHQGQILKGTNAIGDAYQGQSVSISNDGNTAVIGGFNDNAGVGAAWVFTRNGGVWSEQAKLIPNDNTGASMFGFSVAISGDGSTVAVGGPLDNTNLTQQTYVGAAWIFKRSGSTWSQQGSKLLSSGVIGPGQQGVSIALDYAGNRVAVGAPIGNNPGGYNVGGVCIYGLTSGSWVQETYTYATGGYFGMGASVALSANGNRVVVGQPGASGGGAGVGAAIIMDRSSSGTWTTTAAVQGTLPVGNSQQGESVAISDDGNTIVVGGASSFYTSPFAVGASWIFTYDGSNWNQEGNKYVGTGAAGNSKQGHTVSMSADGNTFVTGGFGDGNNNGAIWVFSKTIPPVTTKVNDFSNIKVNVYPNPTLNIIHIHSSENLNNELLSMDGKVVLSRNSNTSIDISSLTGGIYFMNLYNNDGVKVKVEKIIKK